MTSKLTALFVAVLLAATTATGISRAAETEPPPTPDPAVGGPIGAAGIHGHPWFDPAFEVASIGYVEEEYFISGSARDLVNGADDADYATRIFVVRPAHPDEPEHENLEVPFNGTVVVEWDNVTAQAAFSPMWTWLHPLLLREGHAFVSVSAQAAGVCCGPLSHNLWDPVRYGDLHHPGDDYSFDIFSQAVQALEHPGDVDPMGGLDVERVIATGNSQSASRLYTYITEVQDQVGLIDGFQIHGGGGKDYGTGPSVPVMHLFSEREIDADDPTGDNLANYRMWELPGSSHNDADTARHIDLGGKGARNSADTPKHSYAEEEELHATGMPYGQQGLSTFAGCQVIGQGGNEYPARYAVMANLHQLDQWLRGNLVPAQPPRTTFDEGGAMVRDELDHPLGGVRLPPLAVPVARYFATTCELFGHTVALDPLTLRDRYPTKGDYVDAFHDAAAAAVEAGWLLPADAAELNAMAEGSAIPDWSFGLT